MSQRPTAVDLFAGAGGMTLGFESAGFDVLTSVEYDAVHAATHAYNFPHTEVLCRDISRLTGEEVLAAARRGWVRHGRSGAFPGDVDVVFGGPPCQGFSTMGKRLIEDERNKLVFHFFRLVTELRPRYFVMENVPGMAVGGHQTILERLIEEFGEAGYRVAMPVRVLEASHFGVPQARKRLFLLGTRDGEAPLEYPIATTCPPTSGTKSRHSKQLQLIDGLAACPTVWDALGDLPDADLFDDLINDDEVELSDSALNRLEESASGYVRLLRAIVQDPTDFSYPRVWDRARLTSSMRTAHTPLSIARFAATIPGEVEPISRFFRLPPDGLCNTLRAGTGSDRGAYTSPRPIHPTLPRVITVREAARLHSYPDWFRFHWTKWHGFRQVGNSVPPLLGRAVARQVMIAMGVEPIRPPNPIQLGDSRLLRLSMSDAAEYFGADPAQLPSKRERTGTRGMAR